MSLAVAGIADRSAAQVLGLVTVVWDLAIAVRCGLRFRLAMLRLSGLPPVKKLTVFETSFLCGSQPVFSIVVGNLLETEY